MRNVALAILFAIATFSALASGLALLDVNDRDSETVIVTTVDCPTEDSCTAQYTDGRWTITQVTP